MGNSADKGFVYVQNGSGWVPDGDRLACFHCEVPFSTLKTRRHHCRLCGEVFCHSPECWGSKSLLPPHLYFDRDPLAGKDSTRIVIPPEAAETFGKPQPMCCVCYALMTVPPLRRFMLAAPEDDVVALTRMGGSLILALRGPTPIRLADDNFLVVLNMAFVGKKDSSGNPLATKYYAVDRPFRVGVDGWRPFNKQTRVVFHAADAPPTSANPNPGGQGDEPAGTPVETGSGSHFDRSDGNMAASGGDSPRASSNPGTPQVSSMRRQRRKSRTDFVLEVNPAEDGSDGASAAAAQPAVQLPNLWGLSCTSILHVEMTDISIAHPQGLRGPCVKLETFSEVILLTPLAEERLAPHTMTNEAFLAALKKVVGFGRVRGKVRMSTSKVPSGRLAKRSKS